MSLDLYLVRRVSPALSVTRDGIARRGFHLFSHFSVPLLRVRAVTAVVRCTSPLLLLLHYSSPTLTCNRAPAANLIPTPSVLG
jgi:hypothetical protein